MRDLKALSVIIVLTGVVYWGVEPYAHSVMHPHVEPANFDFAAEDLTQAKAETAAAQMAFDMTDADKKAGAQKLLDAAKANEAAYKEFWADINSIDLSKGDAKRGEELLPMAGCTACHSVLAASMPAPMDAKDASQAYGVNPPDLSNIGYLYDEKFLAALIKNPTLALKVGHKFDDSTPFPMTAFAGAGGEVNAEIADLVAYFKSIAKDKMDDKEVFVEACARCHDMKYANVFTESNKQCLKGYLGATPPDLSMYIRSRSVEYLNNFLNDTQKMLPGTGMPRVGLNQKAQAQVVSFMEQVGDSKKAERESLGWYIMGYFLILGIFAVLWKRKIWANLH